MMKSSSLLMILLVHCCWADDQTWYAQANALLTQGAYEPALHAYEQVADKTPAVWYNMGNTVYQLGDYENARIYWLRAQAHGDAQVFTAATKNLMFLAHQEHRNAANSFLIWFWWLSRFLSVRIWQLLALIAWYVLCVIIYKRRRMRFACALSMLFLAMASMTLSVAHYYQKPRALIKQDTVLYNGPNSSYYEVATVAKGTMVLLADAQPEWLQISHDAHLGWVQHDHMALI